MREPHDIEKRITAHNEVIKIIKEQMRWYEYRIKYHPLETWERKQVEYTLEVLKDTVIVNEVMVDHLKKDLDKALDKETRGW